MGLIIKHVPRIRQPPITTPLNPRHPLFSKLRGAFNGSLGSDSLGNIPYTAELGSTRQLISERGNRGAYFPTTSIEHRHAWYNPDIPDPNLANAVGVTVICHCRIGSVSGELSSILVSTVYDATDNQQGWRLQAECWNDTGNVGLAVSSVGDDDSGLATPIGEDIVVGLSWDGTDSHFAIFHLNDRDIQQASTTIGTDGTAVAHQGWMLGATKIRSLVASSEPVEGGTIIYSATVMDYVATVAELANFVRTPYQFYQPARVVIPAYFVDESAIMGQLQGANLGADLYNGTLQ